MAQGNVCFKIPVNAGIKFLVS